MSQEQMIEKLEEEIEISYYKKIESGIKRNLTLKILEKLINKIKVPLPILIGEYKNEYTEEEYLVQNLSENFSKNLEKYRRLKNKNRKEFSLYLGISLKSYTKYEKGDSNPTLKTLVKICEKLEITLYRLLES